MPFLRGNPHLKSLILIFLVGWVIYANTIKNPFVWDDRLLVIDNPFIRDFKFLPRLFTTDIGYSSLVGSNSYRPLQIFTYLVDFQFWKLNCLGYHLSSIALHILAALFVYFLSFLLIQKQGISLFAGLLFLVHPIHIEAVNYISGRADSLACIFLTLSLFFYIKANPLNNRARYFFLGSCLFFVLALLSKESAVIFPFIILIYFISFESRDKINLKLFFKKITLFLSIALVYILLRLTVLNFSKTNFPTVKFNIITRILVFCKAIFSYFRILLLPIDMHMARDIGIPKGVSEPQVLLSFLGIGIITMLIFLFYKRARSLFFMGMWFFIFLFPQSSIFPINAFVADHFLYIPSIGFFFILGCLLDKICAKKIFNFVMIAIVAVLSCLTIWQNSFWSDPAKLYKRIIKFSPRSFAAYNNLGQIYDERQEFAEAEKLYKKALELNSNLIEGYNNLASLYFKLKNYQQAIEQLKNISKLRPDFKPAKLHSNMGTIYAAKGDLESAISEYNQALALDPALSLTHYNLARAYLLINNPKEAVRELEKSLAISSSLLSYEKNKGPSLQEYLEAFKTEEPNFSVFNALGILYSKHDLWDYAERAFNTAIELNPNEADLYFNLGTLYWRQGLYKQARYQWKKALKVNPQHKYAKEWLAKIKRK